MPQKRIATEKIDEVKELRRHGYTYRQIHRATGISTGKISEVCEKERPVTSLNSLDQRVTGLDRTFFEFERQFIAVRDRLIEDVIGKGEDFVCPGCNSDFMVFEDGKRPFVRCPRCEYTIVFGSL